jgi:hypothetical protein
MLRISLRTQSEGVPVRPTRGGPTDLSDRFNASECRLCVDSVD